MHASLDFGNSVCGRDRNTLFMCYKEITVDLYNLEFA